METERVPHNNAGGIFLDKDKLQDAIAKCNKMMPIEKLCTIHQCDWEIPADDLKNEYVREVAENYAIWGNDIPEPLFAISNIRINASKISGYGENNGFIRFVHNGVTYIKKYCPIGDYEAMTLRDSHVFGVNKKNLKLNVIGQFMLNAWEDKVSPEVKILYYDVAEDTDAGSVDTSPVKTVVRETTPTNKEEKVKTKSKKTKIEIDEDDFVF